MATLSTRNAPAAPPAFQKKLKFLSCGHAMGLFSRTPCCKLYVCNNCCDKSKDGNCPTCRGSPILPPFLEFRGPWPSGALTILTGQHGARFDVHLDLLSATSPLIATILQTSFPSSAYPTSRTAIHFPHFSDDDFYGFCQWMYLIEDFVPTPDCPLLSVAKLWLLAEKLHVPALQNKLIKFGHELASPRDTVLDIETLGFVYRTAGRASKLARFFSCVFTQRAGWGDGFAGEDVRGLGIWEDALGWVGSWEKFRLGQVGYGDKWPGKLIYNERGEVELEQFFVEEGRVREAVLGAVEYSVGLLRDMEGE